MQTLSSYWAVSSRHWINCTWQVGGSLDGDAKFTADTSAGTGFDERSAGERSHGLCQEWERHGARVSPVSRAICSGDYEMQGEPYSTNILLCASPTLLYLSIFIKITYYHAILNSDLTTPLQTGFRAPISQHKLPLLSAVGSPHWFQIHLLFWQMRWRSWARVLVFAQWR